MIVLTIQAWRWLEKDNVLLFPYLISSFVLFTSVLSIFLPSSISFFLIFFIFLPVFRFYLPFVISYPLSFLYVCPQSLLSLPLFPSSATLWSEMVTLSSEISRRRGESNITFLFRLSSRHFTTVKLAESLLLTRTQESDASMFLNVNLNL